MKPSQITITKVPVGFRHEYDVNVSNRFGSYTQRHRTLNSVLDFLNRADKLCVAITWRAE